MRLLAAGLALTALLAVALPGWAGKAPTASYLKRVSPASNLMATCRLWIHGNLRVGSSREECAWDGRRNTAKVHGVADGVGGYVRPRPGSR